MLKCVYVSCVTIPANLRICAVEGQAVLSAAALSVRMSITFITVLDLGACFCHAGELEPQLQNSNVYELHILCSLSLELLSVSKG